MAEKLPLGEGKSPPNRMTAVGVSAQVILGECDLALLTTTSFAGEAGPSTLPLHSAVRVPVSVSGPVDAMLADSPAVPAATGELFPCSLSVHLLFIIASVLAEFSANSRADTPRVRDANDGNGVVAWSMCVFISSAACAATLFFFVIFFFVCESLRRILPVSHTN